MGPINSPLMVNGKINGGWLWLLSPTCTSLHLVASVCVSIHVCGTYVVHHFSDTELCCVMGNRLSGKRKVHCGMREVHVHWGISIICENVIKAVNIHLPHPIYTSNMAPRVWVIDGRFQ